MNETIGIPVVQRTCWHTYQSIRQLFTTSAGWEDMATSIGRHRCPESFVWQAI